MNEAVTAEKREKQGRCKKSHMHDEKKDNLGEKENNPMRCHVSKKHVTSSSCCHPF